MVHAPQRQAVRAFLHHAVVGAARIWNDAAEGRHGSIDLHRPGRIVPIGVEVVLQEVAVRVGRAQVRPAQAILQRYTPG